MTMKSTKVKESWISVNNILCYPVGLHYSGVCQSQLMSSRDQWVLIQAVIDHLGQDVHAGSPIVEHMMDLEWPEDARNCRVLVHLACSEACRG
jgi:hypothetical protein